MFIPPPRIKGIQDVPGLQDELDTKSDVGHGHDIADVAGLQEALDDKLEAADIAGKQDISQKGQANGYAGLDSAGKIPAPQLPPISLNTAIPVADEAARLALTPEDIQAGDIAAQADTAELWWFGGTDPSVVNDWYNVTGDITVPEDTDDILNISGVAGTTTTEALDQLDADLGVHVATTTNPHSVTAAQVGAYTTSEVDSALSGKQDALTAVGDVPGLTAALADKLEASDISGLQATSEKGAANGYASLDGSGKVPSAQLPDVGGGAEWGDIEGTLSAQTDLQSALNGKAASSHTHAASDITSGTLPIARGGTGAPDAASARDNLDVPSRPVQNPPEDSSDYRKLLFTSTTNPTAPQGDISYDDGEYTTTLSVNPTHLSTGGRGVVTVGGNINSAGGHINTIGGDINSGSGNITGSSGCQIGWTSSAANSPTGAGTNCHIDSGGKLVRQTSQGKLKEHQAPLETTIDEIMAWQPKSFRWVEEMGGHEDIGLIAEEVHALDPRAAWHDHDQVLTPYEEPEDPEDPESDPVEKERYQCCPEQPVVPLGVHYERAWVHLLAATQDFYRRYQEERSELLARIEALEGGS